MKHKSKEKPKEQESAKPGKDELEELRGEIEDLQREKDEVFEKLQRVSADYANFQKRVPKQIADTVSYEREKIIRTLLPVLDNFERTLQNAHSAENVQAIIKGVQIIYDQMLDILKSHGVEQIKALGEKFDPALHEAMMQQAEPDRDEDIVLEEFQKGYKLNGRVTRPSKVVVNKLPSEKVSDVQQKEESEEQEERVNRQERSTEDSQTRIDTE